MVDAGEAVLERVVGVDGEIGGDNRQPRAIPNSPFEEISYGPARLIIAKSELLEDVGIW